MIKQGNPEEGLKDYQQEIYAKVLEEFKNNDRAAIQMATGTGKSFIALQLLADNPNKNVLFVSSSNAIKNQMYQYVVKYLIGKDVTQMSQKEIENLVHEQYPNFNVVLYQSIKKKTDQLYSGNKEDPNYDYKQDTGIDNGVAESLYIKENEDGMTEEEIAEQVQEEIKTINNNQDYIILDELHRAGAPEWGYNLDKFNKLNPNAKILGMTATPERMDGLNIVDDLFNGKFVAQFTLQDAFDKNILSKPKYYGYGKGLIESLDSKNGKGILDNKDLVGSLTENKKNSLRASIKNELSKEDVSNIMEKAIPQKGGTYIVFCENMKHLKATQKEVNKWFEKFDKEPEVYSIHSKQSEKKNEEQLKKFQDKKEKPGHVKLLFTIDKCNEGLHLDNISGVILNRKTNSNIIFLQQIGRAMAADGNKEEKVIIDLANNWLSYNGDHELPLDVNIGGQIVNNNNEKTGIGKLIKTIQQKRKNDYDTNKEKRSEWRIRLEQEETIRKALEVLEKYKEKMRNLISVVDNKNDYLVEGTEDRKQYNEIMKNVDDIRRGITINAKWVCDIANQIDAERRRFIANGKITDKLKELVEYTRSALEEKKNKKKMLEEENKMITIELNNVQGRSVGHA